MLQIHLYTQFKDHTQNSRCCHTLHPALSQVQEGKQDPVRFSLQTTGRQQTLIFSIYVSTHPGIYFLHWLHVMLCFMSSSMVSFLVQRNTHNTRPAETWCVFNNLPLKGTSVQWDVSAANRPWINDAMRAKLELETTRRKRGYVDYCIIHPSRARFCSTL